MQGGPQGRGAARRSQQGLCHSASGREIVGRCPAEPRRRGLASISTGSFRRLRRECTAGAVGRFGGTISEASPVTLEKSDGLGQSDGGGLLTRGEIWRCFGGGANVGFVDGLDVQVTKGGVGDDV